MAKVSKYLSYKEVTKSYTAIRRGIKNIPNREQLNNIINWGGWIFDPVREHIGAPLGCQSVFRCPELNKIIGGSPSSQHQALKGAAGDIDADIYDNGTNIEIFNFIKDNLNFDQLIAEGISDNQVSWVHASYVNHDDNRNEILMMYTKNGKRHYEYYSKKRFEQLLKL
jgi:hypothetical protein